MADYRRIIDWAYHEILVRLASQKEYERHNKALNSGVKEWRLREELLHSEEYALKNPDSTTPPPPDPPPDPPPPGGAIQSLMLNPQDKRCLLLNNHRYTIASHGNVVTAIPGHDWHGDVQLQVSNGESYARLWHILWGDTPKNATPWMLLTSGKTDLSQWNESYWAEKRAVMAACDAEGIVLEVHIFDRGCGGNNNDYKACPWHPDNNVNGLHNQLPAGGTGTPQFYEAQSGSPLHQLQAAYVRKWAEEARPYRGVILEIENEHRQGGGSGWARQWGRLIKNTDSNRLVSYSSLEEDLEAAYSEPTIDIVCKHFGNEGNNPSNLHSYIATHWGKGKLINIDEFANGLGDPDQLMKMCETIIKAGAHFHVEDSQPSAKGYDAAKRGRQLAAAAEPPYCDVGPSGPAPPCPKEGQRGLSMLYINRKGKRMWTGNPACEKASKDGLIKPGDNIVFDSTALVKVQEPVPEGCGTCVENPTAWSHTMGGKDKVDGPCGFQIWPAHSGTVTARPTAGPGKSVTKSIKVN